MNRELTTYRAFLYIAAIVVILSAALLSLGCGSSNNATPTTPTQPPPTPQTGTLHLSNPTTLFIDVYEDGSYLTELSPNASIDYAHQTLGPHSIQWTTIEADFWQFAANGSTITLCLGTDNTVRPCVGRTICTNTATITPNASTTAAPCPFDARPTCQVNQTSLLLTVNASTHDDDILIDRMDRLIQHPTTDPTSPQNTEIRAFVVGPGQHHLDFLHYPPPRWNACVDVTVNVNTCQVQGYTCAF